MHLHKTSLQQLHTFSLPVFAKGVIYAETVDQIVAAWAKANQADLPFLLLGEGSNVLFLEDFDGVIVLNRLKGIAIEETPSEWLLHVGAGENWHNLVDRMLTRGVYGLENLALIPGCVGSAPIQNIGAYGVELDSLCRYVDLLDLTTHKMQRISALECQFGYRDSIFKHIYRDGYAIIAVGFKLTKCWRPTLDYGELTKLNPQTVSPKEIFDSVCAMRRAKLPDPAITGNAGSFFKNPVIPQHAADKILSRYPDMPLYPQRDGMVKLAAGWLIDRCNLKGFQIGGAAVHQNQALVIINKSHATGQDVADLAYYIRNAVLDNFDVGLEPEVRFVDAYGEIDAVEYLS